jgi:hypothetical protein
MSSHQGGSFEEQRLRADVRGLVQLAVVEASNRAAAAVEAEHLLLAVLFERRNPASRALAAAGLDYEAFDRALAVERERSLEVAGIAPIPAGRLTALPRRDRPRWGASAKEALARGHRFTGTQRQHTMRHLDVAAGVLSAPLGTVPRALGYAGLDRDALLEAVQAAAQAA